MNEPWLQEVVQELRLDWRLPARALRDQLALAQPVTCELLPGLTPARAEEWLRQRGIGLAVGSAAHPLRACVVAQWGYGIIFLQPGDDADERFSLAHEAAHLMFHHLLPRRRALAALGERIRPVLDGERPPSPAELLSSALREVRLEPHVHLLERGAQGRPDAWNVVHAEDRVDRVAFELLAPVAEVLARLSATPARAVDVLVGEYGLPPRPAQAYASLLEPRLRPPSRSLLARLHQD